jgi:hypothetical protein
MSAATKPPPKPIVFWVIWAAILSGLPMIYLFLGQSGASGAGSPPSNTGGFPLGLVAALPPLLCSIIVRWAVLPRMEQAAKALVIFVMGLALAESCGIIGIILGGEHKNLFFLAGILAVLQYIPLFASRFSQESSAPPHTKVVK